MVLPTKHLEKQPFKLGFFKTQDTKRFAYYGVS